MKTILLLILVTSTQVSIAQCTFKKSVGLEHISSYMKYKTSRNSTLDRKVNQEGNLLYDVFGVTPDIWFYNGSNAIASQLTRDEDQFDGTVSLGFQLIRDHLWNSSKGEWGVSAIMAHEFAHIYQNIQGWHGVSKEKELHADFLAGYYFGKAKSAGGITALAAYAKTFYDIGDFNFFSENHHGTPSERNSAFLNGYRSNGKSLEGAYKTGLKYLQ